jgi:hypothetical protein
MIRTKWSALANLKFGAAFDRVHVVNAQAIFPE